MENTANARTVRQNWYHELEDMAAQVCDKLCRRPLEIADQEELDAVCEGCPVRACLGRLFAAEQAGKCRTGATGGKEQGKLLELPCEIGQRVYEIYRFLDGGAWEIDVHKVRLEDLDKIGKTVFLTHEEAEEALKRVEEG